MGTNGTSPKVMPMKVTYDAKEDTLRILFRDAPIQESETHRTGLVLDYDQHGAIVGLELAPASAYVSRSQQTSLLAIQSIDAEKEKTDEEIPAPHT
jgi:uncharacterized protein YuzE